MSQGVLYPNLRKNSNGKCPKLPMRCATVYCGLRVNLNHLIKAIVSDLRTPP